MFCDLHTHSTASDGTLTPQELAAAAQCAGLNAIALTDHDTTSGLNAFETACNDLNIQFVPGVEISCEGENPSGETHLLGYFINSNNAELDALLARQARARTQRVPKIITRLNELGVDVTIEDVQAVAAGAMIGRPHIAQVLLAKGYVKTVQDGFTRYLGRHAPAFLPKPRVKVSQAIKAVHAAGGLASLAHPTQLGCTDDAQLTQFIAQLADQGLDAIEAWHSDHPPTMVAKCQRLAERFSLLATGGSDFHGDAKPIALGSQSVPYDVYERLREAHETRKATR